MSHLFEVTNTRTISKFDYEPNSSSSISNHMLFLEESFFIFSYKNTISVLAIIDSFLPMITSDNIFTFDFPSTLIQVRGDIGDKNIVVLYYDSSKNLSIFATLLITNIIHRISEFQSQIVVENKINDFYVVSQRKYLIIDSNRKISVIKDNETIFKFNDYADVFLFDLKNQIITCVNNENNNIVIWSDDLKAISFQENLNFLGKKNVNYLVVQIGFFFNFIFFLCDDGTLNFYSIKDKKIMKENYFIFNIEKVKSKKNLVIGANDIDRILFIFERDRNFAEVFLCENSENILMLNPIYFFEGIIGVAFNFGKKNDDNLSTMYLLKNDGMIKEIGLKKQKNVEEKIEIFKKNEQIELNKIENELKIKNTRIIKKFEIFVEKKINSLKEEELLNEEQVSNFQKETKIILKNFKEIFKEIYQNSVLFYKEEDEKQLFLEYEKMKSFYNDEQIFFIKNKLKKESFNRIKKNENKDDISNDTIKKMFSMQRFAKKEQFNSKLFSLFLTNEKKEKYLDYDSSCKEETILQIKLINKQINDLKTENLKIINFLNQLKKYSSYQYKEKTENIYKTLFISFMKYFEDYYYTLKTKFEQQIKTKIDKLSQKDKIDEKINIIEICTNNKKDGVPSFNQQKLQITPHQIIENKIKFVVPTKTFSTTKKCVDIEDIFSDNSEDDEENDDSIENNTNNINQIIKDYETYYNNTKELGKTIKHYNKEYNELMRLNINLKKIEKERKNLNDIALENEFLGNQKENEKRQAQVQVNSDKKFSYKPKINNENENGKNTDVNVNIVNIISNEQKLNEKKESSSINPFVTTENPLNKENNPFLSINNPPKNGNETFPINTTPNTENNNPFVVSNQQLKNDNNPFTFQPTEKQKITEKNNTFPPHNFQIKPSLINNNEKPQPSSSINPFLLNNKNINQTNTNNMPFSNLTNNFTNFPTSNQISNTQTVFNPLPLKKETFNPFLNTNSSQQTSNNFMFPSNYPQQEKPVKQEYQNPFYMAGMNKNSQTKAFSIGEKDNSFLVIHKESKEKKDDIFTSSISPIRKVNIETPQVLSSENKQQNPFANIGISFGQDFFNLNKK